MNISVFNKFEKKEKSSMKWKILEICNGNDSLLQFTIQAVDPNGDNITATVNGLPSNATSTITNNATASPVVNVSFAIPNPFVTNTYNF